MFDSQTLLTPLLNLIGQLPFECLQNTFMQQAFLAIILLSPIVATLGIQILQFKMSFFSDAIGHSAFAGVALGIICSLSPTLTMPLFAILMGLIIALIRQKTNFSSDTIIGIAFSAVVALGLALLSRYPALAKNTQQFLYGDILTITANEIFCLAFLFILVLIFQFFAWNKLLLSALHPTLAKNCEIWHYCFAALTALVIMFAVRSVGVLLVTALLIVPAAAARCFANNAYAMFWLAQVIALFSGLSGLLLSAQDWLATASGATIVLIACFCFLLGLLLRYKNTTN